MVILRTLWRKIKKEKKRFFRVSSPTVHNVQYGIDSYSHNFDDGYSSDPDDASRSFSARFAIPSLSLLSRAFNLVVVTRSRSYTVCGSKMANLRKLWRKMKKEKKRSLQYDIDSYSKNFNDGYNSSNSDNANSSFSVRFGILNSKVSFGKRCEETSSDDDTSSQMSC
ncbi:hypothetical protein K1719_021552 [Acacia pycnantha]|nr:hypothetical protein K1719_021552 [Acacia pycnantha]